MIKAVLSDWGHTLFDTAGSPDFVRRWARYHGRAGAGECAETLYREALTRSRAPEELAKGRDKSLDVHRRCWLALWSDLEASLPGISGALYEFETSALGWTPYVDTRGFLEALAERRIPLVVVSDVPFDLRPIFAHHGLDHLVHGFLLSGEHGTVKAEGVLFRRALASVGVAPGEAIMVGDNPANDGCAVHEGIRTLLLAPVPSGAPRGLDAVLALVA